MSHAPTTSAEKAADPAPDTLALARRIAALARERRATDLVLLDVRSLVDYTDYFLVATGQSARQNQAIGEHVVKSLKAEKRYAISKAGLDTGRWICVDLADVVFHVFDAETRARYDLELLWADAPRVEVDEPPPVGKRRRRAVRQEAMAGADADNAPDDARPVDPDAPEPEPARKPLPSRRRARAEEAAAAASAAPVGKSVKTGKAAKANARPKAAPKTTPKPTPARTPTGKSKAKPRTIRSKPAPRKKASD